VQYRLNAEYAERLRESYEAVNAAAASCIQDTENPAK
jgi:hypothetical protein